MADKKDVMRAKVNYFLQDTKTNETAIEAYKKALEIVSTVILKNQDKNVEELGFVFIENTMRLENYSLDISWSDYKKLEEQLLFYNLNGYIYVVNSLVIDDDFVNTEFKTNSDIVYFKKDRTSISELEHDKHGDNLQELKAIRSKIKNNLKPTLFDNPESYLLVVLSTYDEITVRHLELITFHLQVGYIYDSIVENYPTKYIIDNSWVKDGVGIYNVTLREFLKNVTLNKYGRLDLQTFLKQFKVSELTTMSTNSDYVYEFLEVLMGVSIEELAYYSDSTLEYELTSDSDVVDESTKVYNFNSFVSTIIENDSFKGLEY